MAVIARAASDPAVDIDKMERLLQMQERILAQRAKAAFSMSLASAQMELPAIEKRGKVRNKSGAVQSTYPKWEDINERIKPILERHGFSLSFRSVPVDSGVKVHAVLTHRDGHSEESVVQAPPDQSGNKNNVQAIGSSLQYCKRYAADLLLNLTTVDLDDDGRGGSSSHDGVSIDEAKGIYSRWKSRYPKGTPQEFEEWVETTCGVKQPTNPDAWRRRDLDLCTERLANVEC